MAEPVTPTPDATPEPEPEGQIDVQGQKFVPVSALVAERTRAREATEARLHQEYASVKERAARADQLAADLNQIRPQIAYLQEHPELLQPPTRDAETDVSDEDAEKYARRLELYTASGLDTRRAKQIIADNRSEMARVAADAAQRAVEPTAQAANVQASRHNFVWAAQQVGSDGLALVDPTVLAAEWAKLPAELTAQPEVAAHILRTAIGEAALTGKRQPAPPGREPLHNEAPGGGRQEPYVLSDVERRLARTAGLNEKQWADSAKQYKPDALNVLGD